MEREVDSKEENSIHNAPVLFSLNHPLEELKPVAISGIQKTSYICKYVLSSNETTEHNDDFLRNPHQRVVFSSVDSPLLLTYDTVTRHHSIWIVKQFVRDEHKSYRMLVERQRELRNANRMGLEPGTSSLILDDEENIFVKNNLGGLS